MKQAVGERIFWVALVLASFGACTRQSPQQPLAQDAQIIKSQPLPVDEAPAPGGEPCGAIKCAANEVCCNQSCGICTPAGGVCTQQFCEPEPVTQGGSSVCKVDADCVATSDYCTGCNCRALGPKQQLPACAGPGVRCFADPCLNKTAVCKAGHCEIVSKS